MRFVPLVAVIFAIAGCSFSPPKPPECQGEFRPINIEQKGVHAMSANDSLALCLNGRAYVQG